MKTFHHTVLIAVFLSLFTLHLSLFSQSPSPRTRHLLNEAWLFHQGDLPHSIPRHGNAGVPPADGAAPSNANGVASYSPGLPESARATLGKDNKTPNPNGA